MDVNTFIEKSGQQIKSHRIREAMDYALSCAREADYPQFKILCLHTVVEICHFYAGDGEASSAWCSSLLNWMDKNPGVLTDIPSLREVMEDMYIKECELLADAATSYEEYFGAMERIQHIRSHTDLQGGQVELTKSMQAEGQPWSNNMMSLVTRYSGSNDGMGQLGSMHGSAATLYGLLLQNRRKLRLSRTDLKLVMKNYSISIGNITAAADDYYKNSLGSLNPNDYLFMYEKAARLIEESRKDVMEPNAGEEQIAYLDEQKKALIGMSLSSELLLSPPEAMGIITNPELIDEIMELRSRPGSKLVNKPIHTSGITIVLRMVLAALSLFLAITRAEWWWYLWTVFFVLTAIGRFLIMRNEKNKNNISY